MSFFGQDIIEILLVSIALIIFAIWGAKIFPKNMWKYLMLGGIGFILLYSNILAQLLFTTFPNNENTVMMFFGRYGNQILGLSIIFFSIHKIAKFFLSHISIYYQDIARNSHIGVYLLQNNIIVFANQGFANIFGYERNELVGMSIFSLISSESLETVKENLNKQEIENTPSLHYECKAITKQQKEIIVEIFGSTVNYLGKPAIHGTLLDITERRATEQTLQQSETKFRIVSENLGEGLIMTDLEEKILYVNNRLLSLVGYTYQEMLGAVVYELLLPQTMWEEMKERNKRRRDGVSESYEIAYQRKDGSRFWAHINATPLKDETGKIIGTLGTVVDITERKRTEEILQKSEARFRTVIENLGEGLFITGMDDVVLFANSRLGKLLGCSNTDIINTHAKEIFQSEEQWHTIKKYETDNHPKLNEIYLSRKDGQKIWIETHSTPFKDTNGNIIGTLVTLTDISERKDTKNLQTALQNIAEKTSIVVNMDEFYVSIHNIVKDLMYAGNFYIALYDSSTNLINFPYFVDEYDPPPLTAKKFGKGLTEYVLRTGELLLASPEKFEELIALDEVEAIGAPSVDWIGVPLKTGENTFGALVVQSYDDNIRFGEREKEILVMVSQHIANAIQRKVDEEAFRAVWNHSADGMRLTDKDGKIMMVNFAYTKMLKLKEDEIIGKTYPSLQHSTAYPLTEYTKNFEKEHIPLRMADKITLLNGEELFVEVTNSFIKFGTNQKMMLSVFRDVSEQKRLEQQLLHAQKMESIGVLAGGIAHDFNNVLAMINGSAQLLKMKNGDPKKVFQYAETIISASERGAGIAKQLLMFARSEKAKLQPVRVADVLEEVQKLLKHSIPKSITIQLENNAPDVMIMGDVDKLHQIIINLSVNARDAIENNPAVANHGLILFQLSTTQRKNTNEEIKEYLQLRISDNGTGMSEETQQRIFEPFYTTKSIGKGTGLGLSIVHGIVKSHEGIIEVHSELGKGTAFIFYFPTITTAQEIISKKNTEEKPSQQKQKTPQEKKYTILVVDDEETLRTMLEDVLVDDGHKVICAVDGIDAVEKYTQYKNEIDLVISDIGMPRMGGEQALQKLQEINPQVKTIFITGYLDPKAIDNVYQLGAKGVIHKPFNMEEVFKTIDNVMA